MGESTSNLRVDAFASGSCALRVRLWRICLAPPAAALGSQSGVQNSYTSGALKLKGSDDPAPCRCCPGACGLEDRRASCYTNDAFESGGCVRYCAELSSSSARR